MISIYLLILCFNLILVTSSLDTQDQQITGSHIDLVATFTNSLVPFMYKFLTNSSENAVFSPFGLANNLAMMWDAAGTGKASDEILKAFRLENYPSRQFLRKGFHAVISHFEARNDESEVIGTYNRVAVQSMGVLTPTYKSLLEEVYKANITEISDNSTDKNNVTVIELRTDTGLMSHWKDFSKLSVYTYLTYKPSHPFVSSGKTYNVPMIPYVGYMHAGYSTKLGSTVAQLLFEEKTASLILVMPDTEDLDLAKEHLTQGDINSVITSLKKSETEVLLPQLTILNKNLELIPFLKRFEIKTLFNATRDYDYKNTNENKTNETKYRPMHVTSMRENVYFSTSFVAVNSISSVISKLGDVKFTNNTNAVYEDNMLTEKRKRRRKRSSSGPGKIIFDRPFLFFITHIPSNIILIAGQVVVPYQIPYSQSVKSNLNT